MKRKGREIRDFAAIVDMPRRCGAIRLGLWNGEYPYVVPVSSGLEVVDGKASSTFTARPRASRRPASRRTPMSRRGRHLLQGRTTNIGITARYESVIGFGVTARTARVGRGKTPRPAHARRTLGYDACPLDRCRGLKNTVIHKVVLAELTGKRNLPGSG